MEIIKANIEKLIDEKLSTRKIAKILGVSQNKVVRILKNFGLKTFYSKKIIRNCKNCGKTLQKKSQKVYCSNKCHIENKWKEKVKMLSRGVENTTPKTLKKYLDKVLKKNSCELCGQKTHWNNKPLVLQLDHIDGNSDNNSIDNLRLLCPNCHSQTETFSSKGYGNTLKKDTKRNFYLREYKVNNS